MVAGAIGTLAMDVVWYQRYRRDGGKDSFAAREFPLGVTDWDEAGAPAQVGKRFAEGFLGRPVPSERAGLTNTIVHWGTGIGWGAMFGLWAGSLRSPRLRHGILFSPIVWAAPYLALTKTGIYKPISEYDAKTLWEDFSAHVVYGAGLGATFSLLGGRSKA